MRKKIGTFLFAFILLFSMISSPLWSISAFAETMDDENDYKVLMTKTNVETDKAWNIKMNSKLDIHTITKDNVYVLDQDGNKMDTSAVLQKDQQTITIQPPTNGYNTDQTYTLFVTDGVASSKKKFIKQPVKMQFTTAKKSAKQFVANPENNNIDYTKNVEELSSKTLKKLKTTNYDQDKVVFAGKIKEVISLNKNDVIILPATKEYPFGYAKKVSSINYQSGKTVIQTKEPILEEVIDKDSEISTSKELTIDDFKIDEDQIKGVYTKKETPTLRVFGIENDDQAEISIEQEHEGVKVKYENIVLQKGTTKTIRGKRIKLNNVTLNGSVTFGLPRLHTDGKLSNLKYLEFNTQFKKDINIKYSYERETEEGAFEVYTEIQDDVKRVFDKTIDLGVNIPVKLYGIAGAKIGLALVGEGALSGEVSAGTELASKLKVGFRKNNNGKMEAFNKSTVKADMKLGKLEGKAEASLALRLAIHAQVVQFQVGELDTDVGIGAEVTGEASKTLSVGASAGKESSQEDGVEFEGDACVRLDVKSFFKVNGNVGTTNHNIPFEALKNEKPLYEASTCDVTSLRVSPKTIKAAPGEEKLISLSSVTNQLKEEEIELPDKSVKMSIERKSVATVDRYGYVTINKNAQEGDKATLKVEYEDIKKNVDILVTKANKHALEGQVLSSTDNGRLSDVTVKAIDKGMKKEVASTTTDAQGQYTLSLPEGEYELVYKKNGYKESTRMLVIDDSSDSLIKMDVLNLVPSDAQIIGISGTTTNAVTGEKLTGVRLEFYNMNDMGKDDVEPVAVTSVDEEGHYTQKLDEGMYSVEVIPDSTSYLPMTQEITVNATHKESNFAISPILKEGHIRIVLSWGKNPRDLDAHLYGPSEKSDEIFHLYYRNKGNPEEEAEDDYNNYGANLDLDDINSFGPETITIYEKHKNIYRFIVHRYAGRGMLSESGATVKVYFDDQQQPIQEFTVPFGKEGDYWHVFDLDAMKGKIYEVNEVLEENPMSNY
ncbi:carboxypeptidase regulatory-like domain-containing protein [Rummeliibacillus pycnus]|uniref:carboxypeptidase regulatory-like domain-containing protein n=1 Tax=Rummeliibacillus pycnus TaxID=101070 RepID=UPI003D27900B